MKIIHLPGKKPYCESLVKMSDNSSHIDVENTNQQPNMATSWHQQKLRPFFKTVINTITIDLPDTFKHFFRKSPSKTQPPKSKETFTFDEVSQGYESVLDKNNEKAKDNIEKPSVAENLQDPSQAVEFKPIETARYDFTPLSEDRRDEQNEDSLTGRQAFDQSTEQGIEIKFNASQKRSINTRSRKGMPAGIPSKQIIEMKDEDIITKHDLPSPKDGIDIESSQQQSLLEIKWDEISAFNLDVESCLDKCLKGNDRLHEGFTNKTRQSLESNGPGLSDTDCTNIDEDVSNSISTLSTRPGVNEYIMANQSRSWPERKV